MADFFDHNASTPPAPSVIKIVGRTMQEHYANPSSVDHVAGSLASSVVSRARETIATGLSVRPAEIIFTSGATEANGLAIRGAFEEMAKQGRRKIISASTEHPSVLMTLKSLECRGADVTILPVNADGLIDLQELENTLEDSTALVTIMAANNETGVLQPLSEIGEICAKSDVMFHSDITQLVGYAPVNLESLGVHLASFSAHKMYGPKGVGALFAKARRPRARIAVQQTGGGQEKGLRSGTLNTEGIAGFGEAFRVRDQNLKNLKKLSALRDLLQDRLLALPDTVLNGHADYRLPHTLNISIEGVDPHALQFALRDKVIFSTSSACSTQKVETSSVLTAMFGEGERAKAGFRVGLGFGTTNEQVERAARAFEGAISQLRSGSLGWKAPVAS
jgi:cysteine desulfurase|tara:strand:+ start:26949 stop:28124 length:1176 start_codon:yes stop_codon:yes gene_type:complete